jgi:phosphohistidine phosphatase SixA
MKRSLILLALVSATILFAQSPSPGASGTIFLVRHAEKISDARDALLSRAGENRATCLAKTLRDAHIGAIYATEVKRTQQTAEPLAKELGLQPVIVRADDSGALVSKVKQDLSSRNVLVVVHSDTLPKVLSQLGITGSSAIGSNDYDLLFVVTNLETRPGLTTLHYCPSAAPSQPKQTQEMQRMR